MTTLGQYLSTVVFPKLDWAEKDYIIMCAGSEFLIDVLLDLVCITPDEVIYLEDILCLEEGELMEIYLNSKDNMPRVRGEY